jgi:ribose transport system permease protein
MTDVNQGETVEVAAAVSGGEGGSSVEPSRHASASLLTFSNLLPRFVLVAVWALMVLVYAILEPRFFQVTTFRSIFAGEQALVFLAIAILCTLIVGEIDLSVASILGLAAITVVVLNVDHGWNVVLASFAGVAVATACGFVNAVFVVKIGVNPIIATLGSGTFFLGISLAISNMVNVSGLSRDFGQIARYEILGLPISFWYGIVLALAFAYVLLYTPLGQRMQFTGASAEVARLAGVNVQRIRFGSFVVAGFICGVGGVILVASLGGFQASGAAQYLLPAFAGAFLSVAVIQPGKFNAIGAVIGIYFLRTGIVGLQIMGLREWIISAFYGGAMVSAVSVATIVSRRHAV